MNSIHFKLRSSTSTEWSVVHFPVPSLTALDVKKLITRKLAQNGQLKLDDPNEVFDFTLTNAQTGEDYRDDGLTIHRNTSLLVKRINSTPERTGILKQEPVMSTNDQFGTPNTFAAGNRYAHINAGGTLSSAKQAEKQQAANPASNGAAFQAQNSLHSSANEYSQSGQSIVPTAEDEGMLAVLAAQQSHSRRPSRFHPGQGTRESYQRVTPGNKPAPHYVCRRCGQGGHYIQFCPTNGDPQFDGRRQKVVGMGLPKMFLQPIEDPKALSRNTLSNVSQQPPLETSTDAYSSTVDSTAELDSNHSINTNHSNNTNSHASTTANYNQSSSSKQSLNPIPTYTSQATPPAVATQRIQTYISSSEPSQQQQQHVNRTGNNNNNNKYYKHNRPNMSGNNSYSNIPIGNYTSNNYHTNQVPYNNPGSGPATNYYNNNNNNNYHNQNQGYYPPPPPMPQYPQHNVPVDGGNAYGAGPYHNKKRAREGTNEIELTKSSSQRTA